jgi:ryanodine receptor 2
MNYNPNPIDLSDVTLDSSLESLVEALAENVHDTWAKGRMNDGWIYGSERDDTKKHHPCLVPYNQLPDSEKEYDRNTAISTLKFIVKKGYGIIEKR